MLTRAGSLTGMVPPPAAGVRPATPGRSCGFPPSAGTLASRLRSTSDVKTRSETENPAKGKVCTIRLWICQVRFPNGAFTALCYAEHMQKSGAHCQVCGSPIARHEVVIALNGEKEVRYSLCPKHQKPMARLPENAGLADQTFIPLR